MKNLISVIVPVYNVEKYIRKCVDSILAQTYKNIEIILVDDGSTDLSSQICDEYQNGFDNVTVIHKDNGGLVSARKAGIEVVKGDYVSCVDGDDWIDEDMISYLYNIVRDNKSDIAISNRIREYEDTGERVEQICTLEVGAYSLRDENNPFYRQFFVDDRSVGVLHCICGKLLKKELYKKYQLAVPENIFDGEDAACMYPCYLEANMVYVTEGVFYHYRQRKDSISHTESKNILCNWEKFYNFMQKKIVFTDSYVQTVVNKNMAKFISRRIALSVNKKFSKISERSGQQEIFLVSNLTKMYRFPYEKIRENSHIVLYGAGKVGQSYYKQILKIGYCQLQGIYDSSFKTTLIGGCLVQGPEDLDNNLFDYIVISVLKKSMAIEIADILKENGIPEEKIIWVEPEVYYLELN